MGSSKKKQRRVASDREKWEVIFNALKLMLRNQQNQLDSLVDERNLLEQRVKYLYDRWVSDVLMSEDQISQMQRQISLVELSKLVETKKAGLLVGSKQRDALTYKRKLEHAESELNDFKAWFDILSHRCPDHEDISPNKLYESLKAKGGSDSSSKEVSMYHCKALEKEVARLKREYEKLSVKHSSDVSALQAEIGFVWNQYKEMEGNYANQLQTKNNEISQANEKVMKLIADMEQLQSSNTEKDDTVMTLRTNITRLEGEFNQKDGEISRLTKELETLRSAGAAGPPVFKDCSSEPSSSSLTGRKKSKRRKSGAQEEEASAEQLDATVATLRAKITELEGEFNQKDGEISRLTKKLELLQSASAGGPPVFKDCSSEPSSSRLTGRRKTRSRKSAAQEEEASAEQLDATAVTLRTKIAELEAERNRKDGEMSRLFKELQLLRSKIAADTPVLKRCTGEPSSSRGRNGRSKGSEATSTELVNEQVVRRSKRKQADIVAMEETPKLFTSQFKIPKLKSQSPRGR